MTFNKYFPFGTSSVPSDVIINEDSTYTLLSQFTPSNAISPGLVLSKFDKHGTLLLQRDHLSNTSQGYYIYFKNKLFAPINKNAFLVLGAFFNSNNKTGILVAKINAHTLDTVWVRYYSDPIFSLPTTHVIKLSANCYWLVGNKFDDDTPSYPARPIIFQTDTMGNISFRKEVTSLTNHNPDAVLYDSVTKQIYISGLDYSQPSMPQAYVAAIDTNASVLWNKQIEAYPFVSSFFCIEIRNNYLVLSGTRSFYYQGSVNYSQCTLLKVNFSNGNVIWQKLYGKEGTGHFLKGITIDNQESIICSGALTFPSSGLGINSDGIIMKANSSGEGLWMRSFSNYTGSYQEVLTDVHLAADSGYILCGSPSVQGTHSWVIKTDSLGNAPGVITRTLNTQDITNYTSIPETAATNNQFVFYPNPARDYLNMTFSSDPVNLKVVIRDMTNRIVLSKVVAASDLKCTIYLGSMESGVYLLSLEKGDSTSKPYKVCISR